jgi:RsiW-degrading membrane proteinase PrsW (M82 family)
LPHPAGFPPILAIFAVLLCAGLLTAFYQALFTRPARWPLIGTAFLLGMAITAAYAWSLPPPEERLAGISDAWTALRAMALAAGLPEEAVKLTATLIALALFRRGLTPAEAFQSALVVALGFAALENLQYARALPEAAVWVAFGRGIVASFVHSMMAMFQGYFLAGLVRSGWRRWDLLIVGYAVAALAHSLFDWGLVRPLIEYFQTQTIRPETVMDALPIAIPCVIGVIIVSLLVFRRGLKKSGAEDPRHAEPAQQGLIARWRRVGTVLIVIGCLGLAGTIAADVVISATLLKGQPQPTNLSQISPEQLRISIILTVCLAASPMLVLFGWIARWKQ